MGEATDANVVYLAEPDGSEARKRTQLERGYTDNIRWSPSGRVIRLTLGDKLWELSSDGSSLHRVKLLPGQERGISWINWTANGKYFVYRWFHPIDQKAAVWAVRERKPLFGLIDPKPIQLTASEIYFFNPAPTPNGKLVFAVGGQMGGELMRYDTKLQRLELYLNGISAEQLDFSRDGNWVATSTCLSERRL
jgi:hypothetical protein